jgi:hypothetical protein
MGDVVNLHGQPVAVEDDPDFVSDLARFADGLLSEEAIKKKYRLAESTWESLGDNDALVEKIEAEKVRRTRNGDTKRERAQQLVTQAPIVLGTIMNDPSASPRHRVDARKQSSLREHAMTRKLYRHLNTICRARGYNRPDLIASVDGCWTPPCPPWL